ncbi:MAG: hypothetical protein RSB20_01110, partial [Clostridia bacterium]
NIWFILFLIPMFAVLFWYVNVAVSQAIVGFNFMGNIGIGYPGGSDDAVQGMIAVYDAYQKVLFLLLPAIVIMSIGVAGAFNCYKKYMWGEKVSVTKDFFRGVKKHWYKYLIVMIVNALIVLGTGSALIYFLKLQALGIATAGYWVMLISVCIAAFLLMYVNMTLLPMICALDLPLHKQLKNALIISLKFAPAGLILWVVCLIPFGLLFVASTFVSMMLYMMFIMFGFVLYGLAFTAFSQLAIDNVLTPLYQLSIAPTEPTKKKNKNKNKNKNSKINYNKGGKR